MQLVALFYPCGLLPYGLCGSKYSQQESKVLLLEHVLHMLLVSHFLPLDNSNFASRRLNLVLQKSINSHSYIHIQVNREHPPAAISRLSTSSPPPSAIDRSQTPQNELGQKLDGPEPDLHQPLVTQLFIRNILIKALVDALG